MLGGVGLRGVLDVGADEDQAAGAAFAVGGGEARLGAADLSSEGVALAALSLLQLFLLGREFLLQGFLPAEQVFEFCLRLHGVDGSISR